MIVSHCIDLKLNKQDEIRILKLVARAGLAFGVNFLHELVALKRCGLDSTPPDRAGVVYQDINPAKLVHNILDQFVDAVMVACVDR